MRACNVTKNGDAMYFSTTYESPVGELTLASDGKDLCGLWLEGQKYHGATIPEPMHKDDGAEPFGQARAWLDSYFAGNNPDPATLPLAPIGSEFQKLVWQLLLEIPYGGLSTYGDLAKEVAVRRNGKRTAALAVGGAVGHNPISIIIPCHRVVGADGSLTGYAGGLGKKTWLLEHEGVDMGKLYTPKKGTAL